MKSRYLIFSVLTSLTLFFTACNHDECSRYEEFTEYHPVYKTPEEMRTPIEWQTALPLQNPGNIYYHKGFMLINELRKGIHFIDNTNPNNPTPIGFLKIDGNVDLSVRNDVLYADNYIDLVAIDISDIHHPTEIGRTKDIFQNAYGFNGDIGYLVDYVETQVKRTIDCNSQFWGWPFFMEGDLVLAGANFDFNVETSNPGGISIGGSMARFTTTQNHLYTIDAQWIKVFDITQSNPLLVNNVPVEWGIETLFPMAGNLFVGSEAGLFIFDITQPENPVFLSKFEHARACDPVVVSEEIAYVTLRDGSTCQGFVNQLDVIDVSSLTNPRLIKSFGMANPHGLSVVGNTLYLCEGRHGLKIFDISETEKIDKNLLDHVKDFYAYDVIVLPPGNLVMVIGEDGFYQFDATDRSDLRQISFIKVEKP